jgi:hypothetical protein
MKNFQSKRDQDLKRKTDLRNLEKVKDVYNLKKEVGNGNQKEF